MKSLTWLIGKFLVIMKWLIVLFIALELVLWLGAFVADTFFNNAAAIDSCLDSGSSWDYKLEKCKSTPKND